MDSEIQVSQSYNFSRDLSTIVLKMIPVVFNIYREAQ